MSEWWEDAPLADDDGKKPSADSSEPTSAPAASSGDDWWMDAPVADDAQPVASKPTAEPEPQPQPQPQPVEATGETAEALDPEMVEIFLEEAQELQEAMDNAMQAWSENPEDLAQIPGLHRTLHTMKGGARLAGVTSLGDLSHAMESFLGAVETGRIKATGTTLQLAQRSADRVASQVDELRAGRAVMADQSLLALLQQALDSGEVKALPAEETTTPATPAADDGAESVSQPETQQAESQQAATQELEEDSQFSDSRLLIDSQLLTDTELLRESQFIESTDLQDSRQIYSESVSSQQSELLHFDISGRSDKSPKQKKAAASREQVRVNADLLDKLVNNAGEVSIFRSRLEQQNTTLNFNLNEFEQTIERLQNQLRQMEIETEAQILFRYEKENIDDLDYQKDFDPLELDRFSTIQELSRALSETVNDLGSINDAMGDLTRETDTLLLQQSRVSTDLQDGLLRTRMVPISAQMNRLQRVVRQTARSLGKQARLEIGGTVGEMDRTILDNIMGPLEHLLRNAVGHGIENPQDREANGKPGEGLVSMTLEREGTEILLTIADDGEGLKLDKIRKRAIEAGLMVEGSELKDDAVMQFILEPGFSTASEVTQISGRGVGMDVVGNQVKQMGGSLEIDSAPGQGTSFMIRLPYTLAISDAMLVRVGDETYAVPHSAIEGVLRVPKEQVDQAHAGEHTDIDYAGHHYQVRYLGGMLGVSVSGAMEARRWYPVLLVRSGENRMALQVDHLIGNRQIVVKSVGAQLSTVRWITGGTILGDGQVALIIDVNALIRSDIAHQGLPEQPTDELDDISVGVTVMVVDDSITVRKVTSRLLARHNMEVITAKDGVDALDVLQDHMPDVMLLDIEMPRMDGFELARHMKNRDDLKGIPIIMITSRTGEKHRNRALAIGVQNYLGKPYQEEELLENIYLALAETES